MTENGKSFRRVGLSMSLTACTFLAYQPVAAFQIPVPTHNLAFDRYGVYRPQIIDPGYSGLLRQFVDVNGDGYLDYCRFVGNETQPFLACQLGSGHGRLSKDPYGFRSAAGIPIGSAPAGIIDRGTPTAPYMEYCRYFDENVKVPGPFGSLSRSSKVSCLESNKTGFSSIEDTPTRGDDSFDLMRAPDGSLITYVTHSDGTFVAEGTDETGMKWSLRNTAAQMDLAGNVTTSVRLTQMTYSRSGIHHGEPIPDDLLKKGAGLRLLITSTSNARATAFSQPGYALFSVTGYGDQWDNTGKEVAGQASLSLSRDPPPLGKTDQPYTVKANYSYCNGNCPIGSQHTTTFVGTESDIGSDVVWLSGAPDMKSHMPLAMSLLHFFAPVTALQSSIFNSVIYSDDPTLSGQNWFDLTPGNWRKLVQRTSAQGKENQRTIAYSTVGFTAVVGLTGLLAASLGAPAIVIGLISVGGAGTVGFWKLWVSDQVEDQDAAACKAEPLREGCGKQEDK